MVSASRTATRVHTQEADSLEDMAGDVDKCRFLSTEMQAMADKCKTTFEQLLFYLLFTTGMRIGGFANIKVGDVATLNGNEWSINHPPVYGAPWSTSSAAPVANARLRNRVRRTKVDGLWPLRLHASVQMSTRTAQSTRRRRARVPHTLHAIHNVCVANRQIRRRMSSHKYGMSLPITLASRK